MPTAPPQAYIVENTEDGLRLDRFLARRTAVGRRGIQRLLDRVRVNGHRAVKSQPLCQGDHVEISPMSLVVGELDIISVDASLLIVSKPAGIPTLSLEGHPEDTVSARIRNGFIDQIWPGPELEAGLVQRLDTRTSGLLLAARDEPTWRQLRQQAREHTWEKTYLAVVAGVLEEAQTIQTSIGQHHKSRRRMAALDPEKANLHYRARPAQSRVEPISAWGGQSLVRVHTASGHRHQVRVHLASIGHPVVNDDLYGNVTDAAAPGHLLHAESILWTDPLSQNRRTAQVSPPAWWPSWTSAQTGRLGLKT